MNVHLSKIQYEIPFKNYTEMNANTYGSWELGLQAAACQGSPVCLRDWSLPLGSHSEGELSLARQALIFISVI